MRRSFALALMFSVLAGCRDRRPVPGTVVPLVDPRTAAALVPPGPGAPTSDRPSSETFALIRDRPPPAGALGVRFGEPRAAILARHRTAAVPCRESREYVFCNAPLEPVPVPVLVTYEFCGDALCSVAVDATRTSDEAVLMREFDQLLAFARGTLGTPIHEARHIAPGCRGHLPVCLPSRQSQLDARWSWPDGPQVEVSVDPMEDDALQAQTGVTWLSAERVRHPAPDPATTPVDAALGSSDDAAAPSP